jgi:hypothetical protein
MVNKRRRTEDGDGAEEVEKDEQNVRLGEGLAKIMGGHTFCREEDLSRELLLEYLKSTGEIEEVKGVFEVTVQTMVGTSFEVTLEEGGSINNQVRR